MTALSNKTGVAAALLMFACFLLVGPPFALADRPGAALSTPELFVDLARDAGLRCRGKQTETDVIRIRTLLRAALRLDESQQSALMWLYELESRANDAEAAAAALERLVKADPQNTSAFTAWLSVGVNDAQTVEQRLSWLEQRLTEWSDPAQQALIHTQLAAIAWEQARGDDARRHRDEAFRLWPACPDAAMVAVRLIAPDDPPAERLRVLLRAIQVSPLQADLSWEAAIMLDEQGLPGQAATFYEHALELHTLTGGAPLASRKLFHYSRNALARRDRDTAVDYAKRAAFAERAEGAGFQAIMYWHWLLVGRASPEVLEQVRAPMESQFAVIKDPAKWPIELVAQAAWYYCIIDLQPQRALMLAENCAIRAPSDPFVTRVLGWAQAHSGRGDEAQETLIPLIKSDPYAAYIVALLLRDAGDEGAPARIVRELERVPPVGRARQLLGEIGGLAAESQPTSAPTPDVVRALAEFNRDVLDFHNDSARFLEARVELEDSSPVPGEPWRAVFSLTNRGSFPITLGSDWMVNPVFLLSFKLEGDRTREYRDLLPISLDHARAIAPGETVSVRRTIDVGPPRAAAARTPQQLQSVTVSAVLDPIMLADGSWGPSATGQSLRDIFLARLPANTSREAWHARFSAQSSESRRRLYLTLDVMAQLLAERQRARLDTLSYKPQEIPVAQVRAALLGALGGESWEMRVRTLEALQVAGLDQSLLDAARECLTHEHWAVRLSAVRLLARQGDAFLADARRLASEDPDELVRDMARSSLPRENQPAASQAAGQ